MSGGGEIMAGCVWQWVVGVKLWLVVGGGGELMPCHVWSWMVAGKLWLFVGGRGWSHDLVMPIINHFFLNRSFFSRDFFLFCRLVHSAISAF